MILSHKEIEEIAAAVTEDFNEFFFGSQVEEVQAPRATPIDQLAKDYLGLTVSFAKLSKDGSICGLTAYADTEYAVEEGGAIRKLALRQNQVLLDESFIQPGQVRSLCGKRRFTLAHECAHQILYQMANEQSKKDLLESLVDIRDVKIDRSKPVEERMKSYVEQIKNPYLFKVGNTIVRVSYANTQATINDNFVNLLASM